MDPGVAQFAQITYRVKSSESLLMKRLRDINEIWNIMTMHRRRLLQVLLNYPHPPWFLGACLLNRF
jgi:hypothetical protein